jgi:hypothetical protein
MKNTKRNVRRQKIKKNKTKKRSLKGAGYQEFARKWLGVRPGTFGVKRTKEELLKDYSENLCPRYLDVTENKGDKMYELCKKIKSKIDAYDVRYTKEGTSYLVSNSQDIDRPYNEFSTGCEGKLKQKYDNMARKWLKKCKTNPETDECEKERVYLKDFEKTGKEKCKQEFTSKIKGVGNMTPRSFIELIKDHMSLQRLPESDKPQVVSQLSFFTYVDINSNCRYRYKLDKTWDFIMGTSISADTILGLEPPAQLGYTGTLKFKIKDSEVTREVTYKEIQEQIEKTVNENRDKKMVFIEKLLKFSKSLKRTGLFEEEILKILSGLIESLEGQDVSLLRYSRNSLMFEYQKINESYSSEKNYAKTITARDPDKIEKSKSIINYLSDKLDKLKKCIYLINKILLLDNRDEPPKAKLEDMVMRLPLLYSFVPNVFEWVSDFLGTKATFTYNPLKFEDKSSDIKSNYYNSFYPELYDIFSEGTNEMVWDTDGKIVRVNMLFEISRSDSDYSLALLNIFVTLNLDTYMIDVTCAFYFAITTVGIRGGTLFDETTDDLYFQQFLRMVISDFNIEKRREIISKIKKIKIISLDDKLVELKRKIESYKTVNPDYYDEEELDDIRLTLQEERNALEKKIDQIEGMSLNLAMITT